MGGEDLQQWHALGIDANAKPTEDLEHSHEENDATRPILRLRLVFVCGEECTIHAAVIVLFVLDSYVNVMFVSAS